MATVEQKTVEPVVTAEPPLANVAEEKPGVSHQPENKALALPDNQMKKASGGSLDRDIALANVEKEKTSSFIKAWEESEKSKVLNKAQKKLAAVDSWENTKKASLEAKLRKNEDDQEELERKKANYAEQMKNKIASVHKEAEEKRAMVEAKKGQELLEAEEMAAKHRATGHVPKKFLGCM